VTAAWKQVQSSHRVLHLPTAKRVLLL